MWWVRCFCLLQERISQHRYHKHVWVGEWEGWLPAIIFRLLFSFLHVWMWFQMSCHPRCTCTRPCGLYYPQAQHDPQALLPWPVHCTLPRPVHSGVAYYCCPLLTTNPQHQESLALIRAANHLQDYGADYCLLYGCWLSDLCPTYKPPR